MVRIGRLGRNRDDLLHRPFVAVAIPGPDRGREVLQADHAIDEAVGLGRVVRGAQLEHELVLLAEVDLLQVLALGQVPEMQLAAVFAAEQDFRDEAVLERVGRAPFAGDHGVVAEMPPGVIGELLRPAIDLPAAERLEALVVHHEDAARRLAVLVAERGHVDAARPAMHGVRARVAGLFGDLLRLDRLDELAACADRAWCRRCRCARSAGPAPRDSAARHAGCGAFGQRHDEQAFQPKWWNSSPALATLTVPTIFE